MTTFAHPTLESKIGRREVLRAGLRTTEHGLRGPAAMPDEIAPELVARIVREARARGIRFASLEGTFNMSHPDADQRRLGLRRLRVLAAACRPLGTSKIHLCTGTRDRNSMWRRHPDNDSPEAWRDMVACVREATDIASRQA